MKKEKVFCCDEFVKNTRENGIEVLEEDGKMETAINGCCGECWVVGSIYYCPFCGTKIEYSTTALTDEEVDALSDAVGNANEIVDKW